MTKLIYYVACSIDGFIAAADGGIDWLSRVERPGEDYRYTDFYASVDAMIMGRKTYEQALGFGNWPYADKPCYVMTQRQLVSERPDIKITTAGPQELLSEMDESGIKCAWLVGGGELAGSFGGQGLIDEYIISIVPVLLGRGIQLFAGSGELQNLKLLDKKTFESGLVQLKYESL